MSKTRVERGSKIAGQIISCVIAVSTTFDRRNMFRESCP